MPWKIEIRDTNSRGFLSFDLIDVLSAVKAELRGLSWAILDLEAWGKPNCTVRVPELEDRIKRSPAGLRLDWDELVSLAQQLFQVIDGVFVGFRGTGGTATTFDSESELLADSEIVVHAFDSSLWEIYSRERHIVAHLESSFGETKVSEVPWPGSLKQIRTGKI